MSISVFQNFEWMNSFPDLREISSKFKFHKLFYAKLILAVSAKVSA